MKRSRFLRVAASMAAVTAAFPLVGCGGGGSEDPASAAPAPAPAPAEPGVRTFAYVANYSSGDISVYQVDAGGALSPIGTAPAEVGAASVVVHPTGRFAYVLYQEGQHHIATYTIDPVKGMLSFGTNVAFDDEALEMRIHPGGKFAYVLVPRTDGIVICTIDAGTGALTTPTLFAFGALPRGIDIDPAGKFLYVITDHAVSAYAISESGGLTLHSAVETEQFRVSVAVAPSGSALYVGAAHTLATHAIDPEGRLGEASLAEAPNVAQIAFDPLGRFVYAITSTLVGYELSVYSIDSETGVLGYVGGARTPSSVLMSVAANLPSQLVYTTDQIGNAVIAFAVDQEGALTEQQLTFPTGTNPAGITIVTIAT